MVGRERMVVCRSSQQANQILDQVASLSTSDPNYLLEIDSDVGRCLFTVGSVRVLYDPITDVPDDQCSLVLVFADGREVTIPIVGLKRAANALESLKAIMGRSPTNLFFRIPQLENKMALVKHYSNLEEIYLNNTSPVAATPGQVVKQVKTGVTQNKSLKTFEVGGLPPKSSRNA